MHQNGKVLSIDELARRLQVERSGKRIVLCHGVFDLMHIGHVRHLQQARRMGDVLVVTVTPDRFVNKGPHRPVFNESLRSETLAGLDCTDYVAINQWPRAVEAIRLLKPNFYVKGPDYRDVEADLSGAIRQEEEAIRSVGGQLAFTDGLTLSASHLINQHLPVFPEEVRGYLAGFSNRYSVDRVLSVLQSAGSLRVLVVGETIIDEYQYCEAIGKSSKEPMLAVKSLSVERFAGGIQAVANHVAGFCERVGLVSMLGAENSYQDFLHTRLKEGIQPTLLYRKNAPTIVKRRFVDRYFFKKLLEVYEMNDGEMEEADNTALCAVLSRELPRYDVVIVVDFGHGMLSPEAVDLLCSKSRFLALNAQSNAGNYGFHMISKYPRADYVSMAETEIRLEARSRRGDLEGMILDVSRRLDCDKVVVTRGKYGCLCYSKEEGFFSVPAFAGKVVDRVGAGDAFLAVTSLCVAQDAPMEITGLIGNAVGAQAVAMVGHRHSIERVRLSKHIESLLK
ncbi:MAG: PfkB family carbohydrate kinase [Acidobacteriota bacterium]